MKRVLTLSVFALAVVGMTGQQAKAWKKFGFNIGMNVNYESADTNCLWGAYRNGPVPGSYGHGVASTMQYESIPSHGYGYDGHGHYDPGFGNWSAPGTGNFPYGLNAEAPLPNGGGTFAASPALMPYAPGAVPGGTVAPAPGGTLPMPLQSTPVTPNSYERQAYFWPGN